jgi:hypothetical protein
VIESYSQFREDVAVLDYFGQGYRGVFVDVGANDGVVGSNTLLPEKHGWRGVLVEPAAEAAAACRRNRPGTPVMEVAAVADPAVTEVALHEYGPGAAGERYDGLSRVGAPSPYAAQAAAAGSPVRVRLALIHISEPTRRRGIWGCGVWV